MYLARQMLTSDINIKAELLSCDSIITSQFLYVHIYHLQEVLLTWNNLIGLYLD